MNSQGNNSVSRKQLQYRSAGSSDTPVLIRLGLESYGKLAPELSEENFAKLRANISRKETWDSILSVSKGFVCSHEGQLIGMAFLIPAGNPWDIFRAEWSYIRMVGVHPEFQGQGIARELTNYCIAAAKMLNEKVIALHTSEMMPAAMHLYESLGFKKECELGRRLGKRYWLYMLKL